MSVTFCDLGQNFIGTIKITYILDYNVKMQHLYHWIFFYPDRIFQLLKILVDNFLNMFWKTRDLKCLFALYYFLLAVNRHLFANKFEY